MILVPGLGITDIKFSLDGIGYINKFKSIKIFSLNLFFVLFCFLILNLKIIIKTKEYF